MSQRLWPAARCAYHVYVRRYEHVLCRCVFGGRGAIPEWALLQSDERTKNEMRPIFAPLRPMNRSDQKCSGTRKITQEVDLPTTPSFYTFLFAREKADGGGNGWNCILGSME